MIHLVTGYAGYEHIQSEDEGAYNAAFFGGGQYVMEEGNQFEGSILDNNTVRILDGNLLMYGRHVRIPRNTYEDVIIQTGTAGKNRIDLICMTYAKNENDGTETAYLQVIKGSETEGTPQIPVYTDGNILEGAILNHMPLYKVVIEGVVLKEIVPMFTTIPTYKMLAEQYAAQFKQACETHLDSLNILDTMEEVEANTQPNQLAGALALKEGYDGLNSNIIKRTTLDYNNMTTVSSLGASGEFTADKHCRIIFRPFCQYNNTSYIWIYLSVNDKSLCTLSIKGNGSSNMDDAYNIDLNEGDILKYSVVGSDVGHSYVIVPYLA